MIPKIWMWALSTHEPWTWDTEKHRSLAHLKIDETVGVV